MTARILATAIVLAWSTAISACDSSAPEDHSGVSYVGRYNLVSVDGSSLPFLISRDGSDRLEVTGGHIRIKSDHTFSGSLTFRVFASGLSGSSSEAVSGSYELTGTSMLFTYRDGTTESGSLAGGTIAVGWNGFLLEFRK